jgi:hypothetical protein
LTGVRGSILTPPKKGRYLNCHPHLLNLFFTPSLYILFAMQPPKNIILTGASRGIGLAIAKYLLRASHRVFLVARSREPLEKLKAEFPGQVEFLAADLADFEVCLFVCLFVLYFFFVGLDRFGIF